MLIPPSLFFCLTWFMHLAADYMFGFLLICSSCVLKPSDALHTDSQSSFLEKVLLCPDAESRVQFTGFPGFALSLFSAAVLALSCAHPPSVCTGLCPLRQASSCFHTSVSTGKLTQNSTYHNKVCFVWLICLLWRCQWSDSLVADTTSIYLFHNILFFVQWKKHKWLTKITIK